MLGFHYIVLIFILIVYIICFSFFVNPPALAQPVSLPSLPHHFSFPPAPARSWSEGLKHGLQLLISCPKLEQGFEAQFAIDI